MAPDPLELLTVDDVCRLLKVRRSWVYGAVDRGHLAAVRLGRQLRFRRAELARLVDSLGSASNIAAFAARDRPAAPSGIIVHEDR